MGKGLIFVTGAPGWLGTRLVEILRENKKSVRCLVLKNSDYSKLKDLGADTIEGDLLQPETLNNALNGVETVFHCAGIIHPKNVKEFYKINVDGTKNILEAGIKANAKKFVHISSNSAQGNNVERAILMKEDQQEHPAKNYGKSKYKAEQIVKEAQKSGKINTVILRPCWFYGIRQPDRMTKLMKMIKNGHPIIFGDGKNLRSMTYIDNLVDLMMLVEANDKANGQTYWAADERPYETLEIYQEIANELGVKLNPRFIPKIVSQMFELADDVFQGVGMYNINFHVAGEMTKDIACDISKAKNELGYKPRVDIKKGIKRSVEWCRQNNLL